MHNRDPERNTLYCVEFSDRFIHQALTLRKAAKHCVDHGLTADVFLNGEKVGWCDRCGNYGIRAPSSHCEDFRDS